MFTRWQLQTWADSAQKLWQAGSLGEGNIFVQKLPCDRVTLQIYDILPKTFFMLPRDCTDYKGLHSGTWQRYLFKKYFLK